MRRRRASSSSKMKDVTEFLASIELNPNMGPLCLHGDVSGLVPSGARPEDQAAPRMLLRAVPGLTFKEMPMSDLCCGSAGIYNVVQNEMSMAILEKKMSYVNMVDPDVIVTANPGCMLQLRAGAKLHGKGQPVKHVVEILDEAYSTPRGN